MRRRLSRTRRPLLALLALIVALVVGYGVRAADSGHSTPGPTESASSAAGAGLALSALPAQVSATVRLVRSGGPYPYPRNDGVVFHNYGHVLPREPDGWYHEYTVATPGSEDRGARRLITGRDGAFFYTDDHYETFRRVDVGPVSDAIADIYRQVAAPSWAAPNLDGLADVLRDLSWLPAGPVLVRVPAKTEQDLTRLLAVLIDAEALTAGSARPVLVLVG